MFNGIILNQGIVKKIIKRKNGINIFIYSKLKISKKDIGMSISCDGVCLTLVDIRNKLMEFYLSKETINRSTFKKTNIKDLINVETPLKFGNQVSGHVIQGHIDIVGKIFSINKIDKSYLFDFIISSKEKKKYKRKSINRN